MRAEITKYIVETFLFGQGAQLTDDASFLEQGILDSTGVLELVAHLESTYGIKVNDDELTPRQSRFDQLHLFVHRTQAGAARPGSVIKHCASCAR